MGQRLLQRKLAQASGRLRELREELRVVEDQKIQLQKIQLVGLVDELSLRALVAETPAAEFEYREAKKHADALVRHHAQVSREIAEIEQRINDLLDRMKEVR